MSRSPRDALELCRGLLAFSEPSMTVAVPHAALAQVVELASGGLDKGDLVPGGESLEELYDVAALARRYNRAPATVRQWFHDGLFGPPEERRFRGRGYVASAEAVREFEIRTGLRAAGTALDRESHTGIDPSVLEVTPSIPVAPRVARSQRATAKQATPKTSGIGAKIFAEARGGRIRRTV